ncbi:MAG: ABC transporter permease [Bacteroidetes bacterium]|nr:ABC transporter permease [Bacteroidota bacterium]
MIKNYFIVAFRNLWKNKTAAFVNLVSLTIGMACCMLIVVFIRDELSYNKSNKNLKNIYLVNSRSAFSGHTNVYATTPVALGPTLTSNIPQIQSFARLYQRSGQMAVNQPENKNAEDKRYQEQQAFFADNDLFNIFSIRFLHGKPDHALTAVNSVVITDDMAIKYFGSTDVVGKALMYDNRAVLQVTGVVEKMPNNSDLQFDFLISFETLFRVENEGAAKYLRNDWNYGPAYTYVLLKPGQQAAPINILLNQLLKKYGDERSSKLNTMQLEPLDQIHLYAAAVIGNPSANSITYIYLFAGIALLILLIANVNFINLSTARSVTRTKEVGMRKVLGAGRKQIMFQFLGEALLMGFVAFFIAFFIAAFGVGILNELTLKHLDWQSIFSLSNVVLFFLIFLISGLLSGLYPAYFVTRFQLINALKGKSGEAGKKNLLRKILMVAQFSISVILIIGAIVIYQQLQYIRNKPLGFKKNQVLVVPIFGTGASDLSFGVDGPMRQRMNAFSNELSKYSKISDVTAASSMPGAGYVAGLVIPEGYTDQNNIFVPWVSVDYNFNKALQIPLVAGRDFSKATGTDHISAFILNESAVRSFGWKSPQDAIGKNIIRGDQQNGKKGKVIGVVKDFNFNTLDQPMQTLIMDVSAMRFTQFAISIQSDHIPATIDYIRQKWNSMFPERVFEYSFLDRDISSLYNAQENLSRMIEYFAFIAIALCCMGLFSLSSFLAIQRTKEIGIRKVLGASTVNILVLLCWYFLQLVIIALIIASPIAWYIMNQWLEGYAYRISVSWWVFLLSASAAMFIAIATILFQVFKTANVNPVKILRAE